MAIRDFAAAASAIGGAPETGSGHREVLLAVLGAIAGNKIDTLADHFSEDVELHIHGFVPINGSWRGREHVVAAAERNYHKLDNQSPQIEAIVEQGDHIALLVHETGRLKENGTPYELRGVIWWRFEGQRVCRIEEFIHAS